MEWRTKKTAMLSFPLAIVVAITLSGLSFKAALAKSEPEKNVVIEKIVNYLKGKNADMGEDRLKAVVHTVYDESQQCDLDYRLALAVIKVESNFRQDVVSNKGARGLFQIKPSLAKYIAKDAGVAYKDDQCLHEPDKNIKLGVYHLSKLVEDFKNLPTALHAYNAGTSRLRARSPSKGEPKTTFTKRVLKEYEKNLSVLPDADELD